jgi:hypothetical protein
LDVHHAGSTRATSFRRQSPTKSSERTK